MVPRPGVDSPSDGSLLSKVGVAGAAGLVSASGRTGTASGSCISVGRKPVAEGGGSPSLSTGDRCSERAERTTNFQSSRCRCGTIEHFKSGFVESRGSKKAVA
jgi:hypothetical protein